MTEVGYLKNFGNSGASSGRNGGRIEWNWKTEKGEWVCYGHFGYWGLGPGENRYLTLPLSICAGNSASNFAMVMNLLIVYTISETESNRVLVFTLVMA